MTRDDKHTDASLAALRDRLASDHGDLTDRWIEVAARTSWRLQGDEALREELREHGRAFLFALNEALASATSLKTGGPELREPVGRLSFTGGWLAGAGAPIGVAVALGQSLPAILGDGRPAFYGSLMVVLAEAYANGLKQRARNQHRDIIEKSQVVVALERGVPCLFVVGDPDRAALDDAIGRLMMMVAMRAAPRAIVDASGLVTPDVDLPRVVAALRDHGGEEGPALAITSMPASARRAIEAAATEAGIALFDDLDAALGDRARRS